MLYNHLILCRPLLLPSIFPSIRVLSNESALSIRWPKYCSFSFSISPTNEHPGLISFRMDWLDLLAVQGTLKSLIQHHSSKASILWHSAFFIVQLSHPYRTTGKTIALTRWTFVSKVMSLLFNMLSRLVITFLPRSKHLFISWLKSLSAVILEPKKIKLAVILPWLRYWISISTCLGKWLWMLINWHFSPPKWFQWSYGSDSVWGKKSLYTSLPTLTIILFKIFCQPMFNIKEYFILWFCIPLIINEVESYLYTS